MGNFSNSYISVIFHYFPLIPKDFLLSYIYKPECLQGAHSPPERDMVHGPKELRGRGGSPHTTELHHELAASVPLRACGGPDKGGALWGGGVLALSGHKLDHIGH